MPAIKLTSAGKVILKNGKASCSCCPSPSCCILPADAGWEEIEEDPFSVHFSEWPEQLRVNWAGHFVGIIDKSLTLFEYQTGDIRIRRNDDESEWILEDLTDPENIVTRTIGRCLIRGDGGITPGDNLVEDLWADQTEFCNINAEENGFFYPDGGIYNSMENYAITLTPL
jgi:hypothetical protein